MNQQLRDDFRQAFKGRFESVLRWEQLDAFWSVVPMENGVMNV